MPIQLPTFLFINGPPRSGKATFAQAIAEVVPGVWTESFMEPTRQALLSVFFPEEVVSPPFSFRDPEVKAKNLYQFAQLDIEPDLDASDLPTPTVRDAMISFADDYMRQLFGADIFGRLLYRRCLAQRNWYAHFIIDDAGFGAETNFIVKEVGAANCALIRLHRTGCSFKSDNRDYISLHEVRTIDAYNDSTPDHLLEVIRKEFG
jgi:hypothetical protein